jgi:hypothetical protein
VYAFLDNFWYKPKFYILIYIFCCILLNCCFCINFQAIWKHKPQHKVHTTLSLPTHSSLYLSPIHLPPTSTRCIIHLGPIMLYSAACGHICTFGIHCKNYTIIQTVMHTKSLLVFSVRTANLPTTSCVPFCHTKVSGPWSRTNGAVVWPVKHNVQALTRASLDN